MTKIRWEYEETAGVIHQNAQVQGRPIDVIQAVGRFISTLYLEAPEGVREIYKPMFRALVSNDSPIWKPEPGVSVDLNALKNMGRRHDES